MTPSAIASGGTITWKDNGNNSWEEIHTFTSSGSLNVTKAVSGVRILVVGGGGGGGCDDGGGGGGGGISYATNVSLSVKSYSIVVGNGGSGGSNDSNGSNGGNSSFNNQYIGYGGGGGGSARTAGSNGGCGGGAGGYDGSNQVSGGSATKGSGGTTYGNAGGSRTTGTGGDGYTSGGGGGAGAAGGANGSNSSGNGGAGRAFDISGSSVYYAAGGGGGCDPNRSAGSGGTGGGGAGRSGHRIAGGNATANTGSGGGGGSGEHGNGGNGGSGIVIVRMTVWDKFTIKATANANGAISPEGDVSVDAGANKTFTVAPNSGYYVSQILVDGSSVSINDRYSATYTFSNVSAAHTIVASFALNPKVTAVQGINGSITPTGETSYSYGSSPVYTITPDEGYYIKQLTVDGSSVSVSNRYGTAYTFSNIATNHIITATFDRYYVITPTVTTKGVVSTTGGTISPSVATNVFAGNSLTFTYSAVSSHYIESFKIDSVETTPTTLQSGSYTFSNVSANHTIAVNYSQHTWNKAVTGNGIVSGSTNLDFLAQNRVTIMPNSGWVIASVVDSVDGDVTQTVKQNGYYQISGTADHQTTVLFLQQFQVTVSINRQGGSVTHLGTTTVVDGDDLTITATAKTNHRVDTFLVNGAQPSEFTPGMESFTYTLKNINQNMTVVVSFRYRAMLVPLSKLKDKIKVKKFYYTLVADTPFKFEEIETNKTFLLELTQDNVGGHYPRFLDTPVWRTEETIKTTANAITTYMFEKTGNTYRGYKVP